MDALQAFLASLDTLDETPRLGGMARPNGVVIASERYWALARSDGVLVEGSMPTRARNRVSRIPVLRGLVRLVLAFAPLTSRNGAAGRADRCVLVSAFIVPLVLGLLPDPLPLVGTVAVGAALLGWILRGRALALHGAEHRAIAAVESRQAEATWVGTAKPTRFANRCGTNFAALVLVVAVCGYVAWPSGFNSLWSVLLVPALLGATMELWTAIQAHSHRWFSRACLFPGLSLQRLTTSEPSLEETRLALRAAASVLGREHRATVAYQRR